MAGQPSSLRLDAIRERGREQDRAPGGFKRIGPLREFTIEVDGRRFTTYVEEGTKLIDALKKLAAENGGYVLLKHYADMNASEIVAIKIGGHYLVKGETKAIIEADYGNIRNADGEQARLLERVGPDNLAHGIHFWAGQDGIPLAITGSQEGAGPAAQGIGFPNAFELEVRGQMTSFRFGLADENFNPLNLQQMNERYKESGGLRISRGTKDLLSRRSDPEDPDRRRIFVKKAQAAHADARTEVLLPDTTVILNMKTGELFTEHEIGSQAQGFGVSPLHLQRLILQDLKVSHHLSPDGGSIINDGIRLSAPLWGSRSVDLRQGIEHRRLSSSAMGMSQDAGCTKATHEIDSRGFIHGAKTPGIQTTGRRDSGKQDATAPPMALERMRAMHGARAGSGIPVTGKPKAIGEPKDLPAPSSRPAASSTQVKPKVPADAKSQEGRSSRILLIPRGYLGKEPLRSIFRSDKRTAIIHPTKIGLDPSAYPSSNLTPSPKPGKTKEIAEGSHGMKDKRKTSWNRTRKRLSAKESEKGEKKGQVRKPALRGRGARSRSEKRIRKHHQGMPGSRLTTRPATRPDVARRPKRTKPKCIHIQSSGKRGATIPPAAYARGAQGKGPMTDRKDDGRPRSGPAAERARKRGKSPHIPIQTPGYTSASKRKSFQEKRKRDPGSDPSLDRKPGRKRRRRDDASHGARATWREAMRERDRLSMRGRLDRKAKRRKRADALLGLTIDKDGRKKRKRRDRPL